MGSTGSRLGTQGRAESASGGRSGGGICRGRQRVLQAVGLGGGGCRGRAESASGGRSGGGCRGGAESASGGRSAGDVGEGRECFRR